MDVCSICLDIVSTNSYKTPCNHTFDIKCITKWANTSKKIIEPTDIYEYECPICRETLLDIELPSTKIIDEESFFASSGVVINDDQVNVYLVEFMENNNINDLTNIISIRDDSEFYIGKYKLVFHTSVLEDMYWSMSGKISVKHNDIFDMLSGLAQQIINKNYKYKYYCLYNTLSGLNILLSTRAEYFYEHNNNSEKTRISKLFGLNDGVLTLVPQININKNVETIYFTCHVTHVIKHRQTSQKDPETVHRRRMDRMRSSHWY